MRRRSIWTMVLAAAALGVYNGTPARAGLISERQEIATGRQAAQQVEQQYGVVRDRRESAMVQDIGRRLARVSGRSKLPWSFKILNNSEVNAFSLPGGFVYVYQGLIDAAHNDPQLIAGVLAHETGHVAAHHQTKMMEQQMESGLLLGLLFRGRSQQLASLFTNVYALHFSRQDEYQADKLGVKFATAAGFDPYGLPHFLQLLESKFGAGSRSGPAAWLQTHPANSERVKRAFAYADQAAQR